MDAGRRKKIELIRKLGVNMSLWWRLSGKVEEGNSDPDITRNLVYVAYNEGLLLVTAAGNANTNDLVGVVAICADGRCRR